MFPEPYKPAAAFLRSREPMLVRGRIDDSDKGRVVLAEECACSSSRWPPAAAPRAQRRRALGLPGPGTRGQGAEQTLDALKQLCEEHPGVVPVFVHVLLPDHEVVRARPRRGAWMPSRELVAEGGVAARRRGGGVEHAGRA